MECLQEFKDLLQNPLWKKGEHYVGLGNPNAEILIVGKECAVDENSDSYKCEYSQNYNLWKNRDWSIKVEDVKNWIDNPILDWKIFDPLAPYSGQRFTVERRNKDGEVISGKGGTSATWYKYQKLINFIRERGKLDSPVNTTHIDFYKDCFITELNELCRLNNHRLSAEERRKIEENIRNRFDLMIATNSFWSHFKTVILACGPYADALRADPRLTRAIFGCAKVISSVNGKKIPQLSFAISNDLLREIAKQV